MSKSTLSIHIPNPIVPRTIEVPCRLPESFTFWFHLPGYGKAKATAPLHDYDEPKATVVGEVEIEVGTDRDSPGPVETAHRTAELVLEDAKSWLGLARRTSNNPTDSLTAIALAYEAECASHDAQVKTLQALPRALQNPGLVGTHPSERETYAGGAVGMLAQYVAWVFEQACDAQTQRAEAQAQVTP